MRRRRVAFLSLVLVIGLGAGYSLWSNHPSEARQKLQELGLAVTWQQLAETEPKGSNGIELLMTRMPSPDAPATVNGGGGRIDPQTFIVQNKERREYIRDLAKFDTCHPEDWASYAFKLHESREASQLLRDANFAYTYAMCLIDRGDIGGAVEVLEDLDRMSRFLAQAPNFYGYITSIQIQNHLDSAVRFALKISDDQKDVAALASLIKGREPMPDLKPAFGTLAIYCDDHFRRQFSLKNALVYPPAWSSGHLIRCLGNDKREILAILDDSLLKLMQEWPQDSYDYIQIGEAQAKVYGAMPSASSVAREARELFPANLGHDNFACFAARRRITALAIDLLLEKAKTGSFPEALAAELLVDPQTTVPLKYRKTAEGFRIISAAKWTITNDLSGDDELGFEYPGKLPEWSKRTWPQF